jgi:membrane protease YdiL (CAAX protease family)
VALNSYMTNRLLYALEVRWLAALAAATVFAALHWPNPVLVPLTFLGGAVMSWLFARERNIIPLAVGQAIVGTLIWWAFPVAWHHGMRVGPGYYTFHLK